MMEFARAFVTGVMLVCLIVGGFGFLFARLFEKTWKIGEIFTGPDESSRAVENVVLVFAAMFLVGIVLAVAVYPNM